MFRSILLTVAVMTIAALGTTEARADGLTQVVPNVARRVPAVSYGNVNTSWRGGYNGHPAYLTGYTYVGNRYGGLDASRYATYDRASHYGNVQQ